MRLVFRNRIDESGIDPETVKETADTFMKAVTEGYGEQQGTPLTPGDWSTIVDYNTPNYAMLANIERNVYQFAGARNYQQLRDLTSALTDGLRRRSFREFKAEAQRILNTYDLRYLPAEYNTAQSAAYNAASWADYLTSAAGKGEGAVLLEYVTAGDDHVRAAHRLLDGVVRPMNDAFWNTHFPPLDWNCRCTTHRVRNKEVTLQPPDVTIPRLFRTNLAENGLVFPPEHPYFITAPSSAKTAAEALIPTRPTNN
jgi:SPP1 gp7 family putative phage head morphogenesis protein